jgi:hypothetical protein
MGGLVVWSGCGIGRRHVFEVVAASRTLMPRMASIAPEEWVSSYRVGASALAVACQLPCHASIC